MNTVGICGHFAQGNTALNGQTVKTQMLDSVLRTVLGDTNIRKMDTYGWKKKPFSLLLDSFRLMRTTENIVFLPATNGVQVFIPLFLAENIFFGRKLHYVVIGGWLPALLREKPKLVKKAARLDGIYVETNSMHKALQELGLNNIFVVPNFKNLQILREDELKQTANEPFHLCTFSRVMLEKGIEIGAGAVMAANRELGRQVYTLTIYGQVDDAYRPKFESLCAAWPEAIRYGGLVPADQSVSVLHDYDALLFPTYYQGEGFAGTLIDAMAAGLPVIASDWKYNRELVRTGYNGYVFGTTAEELTELLLQTADAPEMLFSLRANCLKEAGKYLPEIAVKPLLERLKGCVQ